LARFDIFASLIEDVETHQEDANEKAGILHSKKADAACRILVTRGRRVDAARLCQVGLVGAAISSGFLDEAAGHST